MTALAIRKTWNTPLISGYPYSSTTIAVTMPNMPCLLSA